MTPRGGLALRQEGLPFLFFCESVVSYWERLGVRVFVKTWLAFG